MLFLLFKWCREMGSPHHEGLPCEHGVRSDASWFTWKVFDLKGLWLKFAIKKVQAAARDYLPKERFLQVLCHGISQN